MTIRILFVADDKATREGYAAYPRGHGYDVARQYVHDDGVEYVVEVSTVNLR